MPHYALSEGVLPLDLSSPPDSESEMLVRRGGSRSESGLSSVNGFEARTESGGAGSAGSGTSATTIKADDDDDNDGDGGNEGAKGGRSEREEEEREHGLRLKGQSICEDEDDWKDPHKVHFQVRGRGVGVTLE